MIVRCIFVVADCVAEDPTCTPTTGIFMEKGVEKANEFTALENEGFNFNPSETRRYN